MSCGEAGIDLDHLKLSVPGISLEFDSADQTAQVDGLEEFAACRCRFGKPLGDLMAGIARIVKDLGVRFAGLDLICKDVSAPLSGNNGRIGEINTTPGIHHHYLVCDAANAVPVAELVLEEMFSKRQGVMILGKSGDDGNTAAKPVSPSGSQAA